jgi:hypothetical protein
MDSHDRYVLAISLLDGDLQARKILADLLEEQGDRGLAQWARGGGNTKHRRLDLALMLQPCSRALGLAVEMMQHVLSGRQDAGLLRDTLLAVGRWESGETASADLLSHCETVLRNFSSNPASRHTPYAIRRATSRVAAITNLFESLRCAARARQCEAGESVGGTPHHWQSTAQQHLREVAAACQKHAQPARPASGPTPAATEIDWQIERTKGLFQSLLHPGHSANQA